MNIDKAYENICGLLGDYQSFTELFDHDGHGDEKFDGFEDSDCRFEQYDIDESLTAIQQLIVASKHVVSHFAVMDSIDDEDLASIDILSVAIHTHDVQLASSLEESSGEQRYFLKCECGWETEYFVHPEVRHA